MASEYNIKQGYRINLNKEGGVLQQYSAHPSDTIYQVDVYKHAANMIKHLGLSSVLELGSGSGIKLVTYISTITNDITGVDFAHAIDYCKKTYSVGQWISEDFDCPSLDLGRKFDLILSVDVIEHLVDPNRLLQQIKSVASAESWIVISTPERDLVRGYDSLGPPENKKHVREWNQNELLGYLEQNGLKVKQQILMPAKKLTLLQKIYIMLTGRNQNTCQVAICQIKDQQ